MARVEKELALTQKSAGQALARQQYADELSKELSSQVAMLQDQLASCKMSAKQALAIQEQRADAPAKDLLSQMANLKKQLTWSRESAEEVLAYQQRAAEHTKKLSYKVAKLEVFSYHPSQLVKRSQVLSPRKEQALQQKVKALQQKVKVKESESRSQPKDGHKVSTLVPTSCPASIAASGNRPRKSADGNAQAGLAHLKALKKQVMSPSCNWGSVQKDLDTVQKMLH